MKRMKKVGALCAAVFLAVGGIAVVALVAGDLADGRYRTAIDAVEAVVLGGGFGALAFVSSALYVTLAKGNA